MSVYVSVFILEVNIQYPGCTGYLSFALLFTMLEMFSFPRIAYQMQAVQLYKVDRSKYANLTADGFKSGSRHHCKRIWRRAVFNSY